MDLTIGTATCIEKHFSHKFRTPFSQGQIFGSVAIDYCALSAGEPDVCLLHSRMVEGDSFPALAIRSGLCHLPLGCRVVVSEHISSRDGNPNLGLLILSKKKGEVVGIYSGTSTRLECNDSLYLFQLDTLSRGKMGNYEKGGRVVDGSPNSLDPWTIYGRINEWVWKCEIGEERNNCEVLPGGTI